MIQLPNDFFDNEKIKLVHSMPEGDALVLIWIKLIIQAYIKQQDGLIYLNQNLPYTPETLAVTLEYPVPIVKMALDIFSKLGMITIFENGVIKVNDNTQEHYQRTLKLTRKRMAKYRQNKKLTQIPEVTSNNNTENMSQDETDERNISVTPALHQRNNCVTSYKLLENNDLQRNSPVTSDAKEKKEKEEREKERDKEKEQERKKERTKERNKEEEIEIEREIEKEERERKERGKGASEFFLFPPDEFSELYVRRVSDRELVIKDYFLDLLPIDLEPEKILAWADWVDYRKEIKKKLIRATAKEQIKFLLAQSDFVGSIRQSIKNQWQGLFEVKDGTYRNNHQNNANRMGGRFPRPHKFEIPKNSKYDYK